MIKCPVCNKIKDNSSDLAKHVIMPTGNVELDLKHKKWLEEQNLDLSKGWKPLADLLETIGKSK